MICPHCHHEFDIDEAEEEKLPLIRKVIRESWIQNTKSRLLSLL